MKMKLSYGRRALVAGLALLAGALVPLSAEDIQARWALEAPDAMVGQALTLTLEVQGTDQLKPPELRIAGVAVVWLGGRPSNSTRSSAGLMSNG